jgi:hypothetical protein
VRRHRSPGSILEEEDIGLAKQKSARTRRAYRLDVMHFMTTRGIARLSCAKATTRR